jgi:multiple sugar transport system ATP-binding protein
VNQIVVKNLSKDFLTLRRGRIRALRTVDLVVEPEMFFVLVGPSGCGKSTLLNIIAGIEKPTDGEVWIGDHRVVNSITKQVVPPRQRDVAMVFQSYALYPHMSVYDNIAFPLKIARIDGREIECRVREVASTLELGDLLDGRPAELSGGQRQRVALGRAIVRKPKVLLLDEPLSNLDALLRTSMRGELKQIQRRLAVTTIYVTHDQTEAMTLGDRIAVLKDGELQQTGPPQDVYHLPANRFVAKFVGNPPMNMLDGSLLEKAHKSLEIPSIEDLSMIQLGLRPEHLQITTETGGVWRARLDLISTLGGEQLLYLDLEGRPVLAKAAGLSEFSENQPVGIDFDIEKLYIFRKEDGRCIRHATAACGRDTIEYSSGKRERSSGE